MAEVLFQNMVREEMPRPDVYVLQPDQSLEPACETLADEVRGDLVETRGRILDAFGEQALPTVRPETAEAIDAYFRDCGWSLPQSVVIDPARDARELGAILRSSRFRLPTIYEEFFTGSNGQVVSSGVDVHHDMVIFHQRATRYRQEIDDYVRRRGSTIDAPELESVVDYKLADYTAHELVHSAGALAVGVVVVERPGGRGSYRLSKKLVSGFVSTLYEAMPDDDSLADYLEDQSHYSGPAIDESWAALNSSRIVMDAQGYDREGLPVGSRYLVGAYTKNQDGALEWNGAVGSLHSAVAGEIIERLDELYPGVIDTMTQVADGTVKLPEALATLRGMIPGDVWQLLQEPKYSAWEELGKRLGVES